VQPVPSIGAQPFDVRYKMRIDRPGRVSNGILHSLKPRFKGNRFEGIAAKVSVWREIVGSKNSEPTGWAIGSQAE